MSRPDQRPAPLPPRVLSCYTKGCKALEQTTLDPRTLYRRQVAAYALWLEDRGLVTPPRMAAVVPPPSEPEAPAETPPPAASATDAREVVAPRRAVLFLGDRHLADAAFTADERALLDRMATAMGLAAGDYAAAAIGAEGLAEAVSSCAPAFVILLGEGAVRAAFGPQASFRQLTGRLFAARGHDGVRFLATLHPRDLIRHPAAKRQAWSDLQLVMAARSK